MKVLRISIEVEVPYGDDLPLIRSLNETVKACLTSNLPTFVPRQHQIWESISPNNHIGVVTEWPPRSAASVEKS
jgi:hypothetical protein